MFNTQERPSDSKPMSNNTIGNGTVLEGSLTTSGNLRVDGKIIGDVKTEAKMVQGDQSMIQGNISAHSADIGGKIKGKVVVKDVLVLEPNSVIKGDIVTNRLIVESGAKFNGQCKIGGTIKDFKVEPEMKPQEKVYSIKSKPKASTA